jgi:hypothetical protein
MQMKYVSKYLNVSIRSRYSGHMYKLPQTPSIHKLIKVSLF